MGTPLPTTTTTTKMVTGAVTVETQTTTVPNGPKSAEMGCGCNCGCKLAAEYVMAIVSGDAEALAEMAQAQPPAVGRALTKKRKKDKRPRDSVAELTAALGETGLQLPVDCGCDCSCEVQDVRPMLPATTAPSIASTVTEVGKTTSGAYESTVSASEGAITTTKQTTPSTTTSSTTTSPTTSTSTTTS